MAADDADVELVTIDLVIRRYRGVNARMVRRWIHTGRLPAAKIGRAYLVSPADVAELLRPTLRPPVPRTTRETPTARAERLLAASGIV
jgi:excisionase family DNA binding protein